MAKEKDSKNRDSMTPEEKLFRVISGNRDFDFDADDQDAEEVHDELIENSFLTRLETWVNQSRNVFRHSFGELKQRFGLKLELAAKQSNVQVHSLSDLVQIKSVNRGLMILVILMVIYLIFDFAFFRVSWGGAQLNNGSNPMLSLSAPALVKTDLSRYMDRVGQRNVFTLPPPPNANQNLGEASSNQAQAQGPVAAPSNYKLVGISWDAQEYVAMIEYDPTKEGASFVRKGDFLGNGVRVEEIKEFTVILSSQGQRWELN